MKPWQTLVKYGAIIFALILIINISVGVLSLIGAIFGLASSGLSDEPIVTEITEDIDRLDIEISAAALTVRAEKVDHITVTTNLKDLKVNEKNGKLTIKEKQRLFNVTYSDAYIEMIIPQPEDYIAHDGYMMISTRYEFDKVEIDAGAGRLSLEGFDADELDLDLGAGATSLLFICVKNADIDGGAGTLDIAGGYFKRFDLDMGIGDLKMTAKLEAADIDLGIGDAEIYIDGEKEDHKLILSKGIGKITVDGEEVGNGTIGDGDYMIKVNGGIGEIDINFGLLLASS